MTYPILLARLHALEDQLKVVEQSPRWLEAMSSGDAGTELHAGLDASIGQEARNQGRELERVRTALDNASALAGPQQAEELRKAWTGYFRVQHDCEAIFGECLRLLGGLALRNQGFGQILDNQIWEIADELIRSCANESIGDPWTSLTVPAPREAVARTLARMIRLRFPAWNVWTVPLAAREYGHVVAEDAKYLPGEIEERLRSRVEGELPDVVTSAAATHRIRTGTRKFQDLESAARNTVLGLEFVAQDEAHGDVQRRVAELVERERSCLHVLVADAYATYTLGVAYASAALLLRFEPARSTRDDLISDAIRGDVVLAMLDRMNAESASRPYDQPLDLLRTGWDTVLQYATVGGNGVSDPLRGKEFVDWIWEAFQNSLRLTARYPDEDDTEGWLSVRKARSEWERTLQASDEFGTSGLELRKLRDALNAAWSWRLENPGADHRKLRRLETATMKICSDIVDEIHRPGDGRKRSSQRPGGRSRG
jgi:hypothetical protein